MAVADLVAGLVAPESTPVLAVGRTAIDFVPWALKDFAVARFGAHDKQVLLAGIGAVLVLVSALAGVLARRRPRAGLGVGGLLGAVAVAAALTRPDAGPLAALPTVLGVAALAGTRWSAGRDALLAVGTWWPAGSRPRTSTACTPPSKAAAST